MRFDMHLARLLELAEGPIDPLAMPGTNWDLTLRVGRIGLSIVLALLLLRLIPTLERWVLRHAAAHAQGGDVTASSIDRKQHLETLTRVTSSLAQGVIWSCVVIVVLGQIGISIAPLLATAGVAGVAIGFGAQTIVKDFFAGFFILLENQFDVGDTVTIGTATGVVERLTMRITVLRDVDGTAYFIPNSSITMVSNRTYGGARAMVQTTFAGTVPESDARAALTEAGARAAKKLGDQGALLEPPMVEGPVDFASEGIAYRLFARTRPERSREVRQALISAVSEVLRERAFVANGTVLAKRT